MDLDDILPVENFSDLTIQTLADRLQRSSGAEQCIYRESELDELWRLIDIALKAGGDTHYDFEQLHHLRDLVHRAHDLVGMEDRPREAAEVLREALLR
ncbi:hypothetical protein M2333_000593 [Sphingobium sp. B11D3B]|uniref:hypothetical protein n=1 Tax=Sphingobium sp. B11D3B TaxID=2940575 RepID=UPI002227ED4C|nr:hypothetical protein [Sphingobium sp. B11D3B]MCW2387547.1 hypothetical protein [Sphingobium sp. B11D3B]